MSLAGWFSGQDFCHKRTQRTQRQEVMPIVVFSFAIFVLFRGHSSLEEASRLVLHDSIFQILFFPMAVLGGIRRYWMSAPSSYQALSRDASSGGTARKAGRSCVVLYPLPLWNVEEASRLFSWIPWQNPRIPCACFRRKNRPITTFCFPIRPSANCQRTGA